MQYIRITGISDPWFVQMHRLMSRVFPPEEVLAFDLWQEPLQDPGIRVFVAVHEGQVVGATEYRYYADLRVAMTDFTIIGRTGLGIGRFLYKRREADLRDLAEAQGEPMYGMFAEVYDPYRAGDVSFGGVDPMNPVVRREVLSHIGYRKLKFDYVHPSWKNDGEAVSGLDLCFLPADEQLTAVPAELIVRFLIRYYDVLPNKPKAWIEMIEALQRQSQVELLPL